MKDKMILCAVLATSLAMVILLSALSANYAFPLFGDLLIR